MDQSCIAIQVPSHFFNITADRFELTLDSYKEETDSWNLGGYGYVATRLMPRCVDAFLVVLTELV